MNSRNTNYWLFLILGILFILGVTFMFLHEYRGLCIQSILADESPLGNTRRYNLGVDLMYVPGSLILSGFIFYWMGRRFSSNRSIEVKEEGNVDLERQLEECRSEYDRLLVETSGGKIQKQNSNRLVAEDKIVEEKDHSNSEKVETVEAKETVKEGGVKIEFTPLTFEEKPFEADKLKELFGKSYKKDDLKIVEGIGPKIASILNQYEVNTWKQLAQAKPSSIKEVLLTEGGAAYKIHDPTTWPNQAKMAAEGDFEKLKAYQDTLKGGV